MTEKQTLLEVKNLHTYFYLENGISKALHGVSFDIKKGETLGVVGESGCGKSMTLKSIAGIERPDRGRICVDGNVLYDSEQKIFVRPQKRHVGYLFQNYALFPTMTVAENIMAGLHASRAEKQRIVQEMSERWRGFWHMSRK